MAKRPVDVMEPDWASKMAARIAADLAALGLEDDAEAVLRSIIDLYVGGGDEVRVAIRQLFDRYSSFRWAAHLPREWDSADEFRAHLVLLSARDQAGDTRDEILVLQSPCARAQEAGIDVVPIVTEVVALSSTVDRYGMGSMRDVILNYGPARSA